MARIEAGALSREALTLLAGVDDRAAQRALTRLPLVLTVPEPDIDPGPNAPSHAEGWLRWAGRLEPLGQPLAVRVALAACEAAARSLAAEEPGRRTELVGLHTGSWGVMRVSPELAASLSPFSALAKRTVAAVRRWLEVPSAEAAETVARGWPELLRSRDRAWALAEVAEVDPHALWAMRWLVASVTEPGAGLGVSVGWALIEAQSSLCDRAHVAHAARDALRAATRS